MIQRVQFDHVTHRFRVIRERPDSLREVFTKVFRQRSRAQDFEALRDVSLRFNEGEVVGIIGRNGSGKSTMLKLIAGVYDPTAGSVSVQGQVAALIELGAGFHTDLTGRENIVINGLLMGLTRKELAQREEAIIEFAELGEFIDSPVKQYSSGMFMRLAFSIATEVDPDILLVDEILSVGDAEFRQKCNARLQQFRSRSKTIILVSHELQTLSSICTRLLLLDHGRMIADGRVADVLSAYEELTKHPERSVEGPVSASTDHLPSKGADERATSTFHSLIPVVCFLLLIALFFQTRPGWIVEPAPPHPHLKILKGQTLLGRFDSPSGNLTAESGGELPVHGWAASSVPNNPITRVIIELDGDPIASIDSFVPRPDVALAYDRKDFNLSGWHTTLSLRGITPGGHSLVAIAIASNNSEMKLGSTQLIVVK